jgi:type III secretion protein L
MTYHLYGSPETLAIGVSRSIIKAHERGAFADAIALKNAVAELQSTVQARCATAFDASEQQGLLAGKEAVVAMAEDAIAKFAQAIEIFEAERRAQIADAAFAAVEAILGKIEPDVVLAGLINQTIDRLDTQQDTATLIEVAPDMLARIGNRVAPEIAQKLVANPNLQLLDCVVATRSGKMVANLDIQLESLAARWGVNTEIHSDMSPSKASPA